MTTAEQHVFDPEIRASFVARRPMSSWEPSAAPGFTGQLERVPGPRMSGEFQLIASRSWTDRVKISHGAKRARDTGASTGRGRPRRHAWGSAHPRRDGADGGRHDEVVGHRRAQGRGGGREGCRSVGRGRRKAEPKHRRWAPGGTRFLLTHLESSGRGAAPFVATLSILSRRRGRSSRGDPPRSSVILLSRPVPRWRPAPRSMRRRPASARRTARGVEDQLDRAGAMGSRRGELVHRLPGEVQDGSRPPS